MSPPLVKEQRKDQLLNTVSFFFFNYVRSTEILDQDFYKQVAIKLEKEITVLY